MRRFPHWYALRKNTEDDTLFVAAVEFIRAYGYDDHFFRLKLRYLDFDGFKYWTMGCPIDYTILINRAVLKEPPHPMQRNLAPIILNAPMPKERPYTPNTGLSDAPTT